MSTTRFMMCECFVCKTTSEQTELTSTNAFGVPDLDLRPPQMQRSTMCWWVQKCPNCGYVATNLERHTRIDPSFLQSREYLTCSGIDFKSDLAKQFYQQYLITLRDYNYKAAFKATLCAAWECDDTADRHNADLCRRLAVEQLDKLIKKNDSPDFRLQKLDLLRRAGEFEQALSLYADAHFEDERLQRVLQFQLEKCRQRDVGRYTMFDVDMQD